MVKLKRDREESFKEDLKAKKPKTKKKKEEQKKNKRRRKEEIKKKMSLTPLRTARLLPDEIDHGLYR